VPGALGLDARELAHAIAGRLGELPVAGTPPEAARMRVVAGARAGQPALAADIVRALAPHVSEANRA
jgi:hypothetical protein